MRILRKILFLSIIITLISSSIPFQMYADEQQNDEVFAGEKAQIFINENETDSDVYLYESDSIDSDVLITLENELPVTLIEQDEEFSFVQVIDEDSNSHHLTGYVLNTYVELVNEVEEESVDSNNDESITQDESEQVDEEEEEVVVQDDSEEKSEESDEEVAKKEQMNENITSLNEQALNGVALKEPTNIYAETSQSSEVLKSYKQGSVLKYYELNTNWYRATIKHNGAWATGYIHKSDVETMTDEDVARKGIALKSQTNVYEKPSTNSKALRSYAEGSILKYRTFSNDWYIARVKYNGKWTTGYIHKSHVENIPNEEVALEGIALKSKTNVYERASKDSKAIRNYAEGSVLKYRSFSENWYIARVKYNGKWTTGYIHKSDVENTLDKKQSFNGIALKEPTNIYKRASTKSSVHKSYRQGTVLKFKSFTKNWYEAVVYVSGKRQTGYIHKNDVDLTVETQEQVDAWALKTPTNVYERASKNSKVIRNDYKKGRMLKLKTLSTNWYEGKVKSNGKWVTGYVHASDISLVNATSTEYQLSLQDAVDIQLKGAPQTDKKQAWVSKDYIENDKVTATELNVRLGPGTGYKAVDKIKKDTRVTILDEYNGWYVIEFDHNSQWTHAGPKDVMSHLDPQKYINSDTYKFQFLDLASPSGASTASLDKYLNGKGTLSGQGKAFVDAASRHGLNDIYLISHALLETGHGKSNLAQGIEVGLDKDNKPQLVTRKNEGELTKIKTVYNMFGIRAFDSCPESCGAAYAYEEGWDSPYKAIVGGAEFIGSDYILGQNSEGNVLNTLYKMRWNPEFASQNGRFGKQYATDIGWAVKQAQLMYNLYEDIGDHKLVLDIPIYMK